ncbi:MAG: DUF5017 domain-containing protein, partial [Bacteroidetes bacterium]|nr:DUF5017 domain-containing protein [Bacteroidota bacterium]
MNKLSKFFVSIFIISGMALISSCVKTEFDPVPLVTPHADLTSNTTIAALNQYYIDSIPNVDGVHFGMIDDDIIIEGVVVGTDESGNFYKQLFIEDGTAGLQIMLDQTSLYTTYRLGQRIFIKCKGLYLGEYGGNMQLGSLYDGGIGRLPGAYIKYYFFLEGLPEAVPAPVSVSIPALSATNLNMLVTIDSVSFPDAGQTFATTTATTNHNMVDKNGNIILIRTSNYANFAGSLLPYGIGSVTGILTIYNGDYQFYVRDLNDLKDFDNNPPILSEGFSTAGSLGVFTQYSVAGDQIWSQSSYNSDFFAKMSGYANSTYNANEDWLISPSMNLDLYSNEKLNFFTEMKYGTAGDGSFKLYFSTDYSSGAPTTGTWTEITGLTLSTGNYTKVQSGDVDLSAVIGTNVHIAFKY